MEWHEMSREQQNILVLKWDKIRKHKAMTVELREKFAKQGDTSEMGPKDIKVIAKWFNPYGNWTWYATEFDPETGNCFGYVKGFENELGYFNFYEIAVTTVRMGRYDLPLERDCHWDSETLLQDVLDGITS